MTNRQIENRIKKLRELEEEIAQLSAEADTLRDELKKDMETKGEDEIKTPSFIVRWKTITSSRLDAKALTAALPEIAAQYTKPTTSRRFTVATA